MLRERVVCAFAFVMLLTAAQALAQPSPISTPVKPQPTAQSSSATTPQTPAPRTAGQAVPGEESPEKPPEAQESPDNGWNTFDTRFFRTTLILTGLFDVAGYQQDEAGKGQVGDMSTEFDGRAERIMFAGALKFHTPWVYLISTNFNGIEADRPDRWSWLDVRLDIPVPKLGKVKIGRQKIGVSQEWMMPGLDWVFMERSAENNAFIPQRDVGVLVTNMFAHRRGVWSAGWFNDWFLGDQTMAQNGNKYSARLSYLAIDRESEARQMQVAGAVYYKESSAGTLQMRARPEINQAEYFVDTGKFEANHAASAQFEAMSIDGPLQIFGELTLTRTDASVSGNPFFHGGYAGASYILTGEHRTFKRSQGYYTKFAPKSPVRLLEGGGYGAWEVAGRYSYVDLRSGVIDGGAMSRWTAAVAWYPTFRARFEFNYGYIRLDRGGSVGHTHGFSLRMQWSL